MEKLRFSIGALEAGSRRSRPYSASSLPVLPRTLQDKWIDAPPTPTPTPTHCALKALRKLSRPSKLLQRPMARRGQGLPYLALRLLGAL